MRVQIEISRWNADQIEILIVIVASLNKRSRCKMNRLPDSSDPELSLTSGPLLQLQFVVDVG